MKNNSPREFVLPSESKPFDVRQAGIQSNRYDVYLSKALGDVEEYVDLFHLLASATEHDVIYIHLNCPGGNVDTGLQLISFMQDSRATIVTAIYGTTASMGTAIFLCGDQFMVSKTARLMVHNFSGGLYGKGNEMVAQLQSTTEWFTAAFTDVHVPFLSKEECADVVSGRDMWFQSPEIEQRLQRVVEHREALRIEDIKLTQLEQLEDMLEGFEDSTEIQAIRDNIDKLFDQLLQTPEPEPAPKKKKSSRKMNVEPVAGSDVVTTD